MIRKRDTGIQIGKRLVVPFDDLAQINIRQHGTGELDFAARNTRQIEGKHFATNHCGELHLSVFFQFFGFAWHIGRAEIDGLGGDLLDTAAGTNGLVVDLVAGRLLVGVGPLGIDGGWESSTCASNFDSLNIGNQRRSNR